MQGLLAIDISKDKLDARLSVGINDPGIALEVVPNSLKGFKRLLKECRKRKISSLAICVEATGSYWQLLASFMHGKGAKVFVVNPARIKAQRKTQQKRAKTDKVDAGVILKFLKAHIADLHEWHPPSEAVVELQSLVRYRETCVSMRTAEMNLVRSRSGTRRVVKMALQHIAELDEHIHELEAQISTLIASDKNLSAFFSSATSIDGIGDVTAAVLIAELRAFAEVRNPRQATAFAGLDVITETSGTLAKPSRISKQGNRLLRVAFCRIAPAACRRKGHWRSIYMRLRARGLKTRQAHVAVARKMLEVAVAVCVSGQQYDAKRYLIA